MSKYKVSVITPLFNPNFRELSRCLSSVQGAKIEHVLVLDGIKNVKKIKQLEKLISKFGAKFLKVEEHSGISASTNLGIVESQGEFIMFLDQDDYLEPGWFDAFQIASETYDVIYSDTTTRDEKGRVIHTFSKPKWSPTRLQFNMYVSHFFSFKRELIEKCGLLDSEFDGSQDHDFALRVTKYANSVGHIPLPLYNWQAGQNSTASNSDSKPYAYLAGKKTVMKSLENEGTQVSVEAIQGFPGTYRAIYNSRDTPVSFVIPTAFSTDSHGSMHLEKLLASLERLVERVDGDEVVLVTEKNQYLRAEKHLSQFSLNLRVVVDDSDFNFSRRVNIGTLASKNENILLLNDDVEIKSTNFVNQLFAYVQKHEVGLVGCLLLFPDYSVQHGGHVYHGLPSHAYYGRRDLAAPFFDLLIDREVSGVTGAVMAFRKSTWESVGGFNQAFPLNFNDVDFCLKIRTLGLNIIQCNSAIAIHHESKTRLPKVENWEVESLLSLWRHQLSVDQYTAQSE